MVANPLTVNITLPQPTAPAAPAQVEVGDDLDRLTFADAARDALLLQCDAIREDQAQKGLSELR